MSLGVFMSSIFDFEFPLDTSTLREGDIIWGVGGGGRVLHLRVAWVGHLTCGYLFE